MLIADQLLDSATMDKDERPKILSVTLFHETYGLYARSHHTSQVVMKGPIGTVGTQM